MIEIKPGELSVIAEMNSAESADLDLMDNKSAEEIFPTISVGLGYGKYVDDIDIDVCQITQILRDAGLSDDQILKLNINISDKTNKPNDGKFTSITGKKVSLYCIDYLSKKSKDYNEKYMSNVLRHELQHFIDSYDKDLKKDDLIYIIKSLYNTRVGIATIVSSFALVNCAIYIDQNITNRDSLSLLEVIGIGSVSALAVHKAHRRFLPKSFYKSYIDKPFESRAFATEGEAESLVKIT